MKLWVIRHAKSSWADPGQRDFERPLNKRGERDGPRMADWLAAQPAPAGWIWTSDAVRARATAEWVARGFAAAAPRLVPDHRLYHADPDAILDVLRETPGDQPTVAVVAHNPGLTMLVNLLGGGRVTANLPTFGVARFDVPDGWEALRPGRHVTLEVLTAPKRLDG